MRTPEKIRDKEYHRVRRDDLSFRIPERLRDSAAKRSQQLRLLSSFEKLRDKFREKIKCAPIFICSCCGGLWYKDSTTVVSEQLLKDKGCDDNLVMKVLHVKQDEHRLCGTCKKSVFGRRLPRVSLCNGLDFPEIPEVLKVYSKVDRNKI